MSEERKLDRRGFLKRGLAAASTALLAGCDDLSDQPWVRRALDSAETLTRITQRALLPPQDIGLEAGVGLLEFFDGLVADTLRVRDLELVDGLDVVQCA